jgi:hypothetical protein
MADLFLTNFSKSLKGNGNLGLATLNAADSKQGFKDFCTAVLNAKDDSGDNDLFIPAEKLLIINAAYKSVTSETGNFIEKISELGGSTIVEGDAYFVAPVDQTPTTGPKAAGGAVEHSRIGGAFSSNSFDNFEAGDPNSEQTKIIQGVLNDLVNKVVVSDDKAEKKAEIADLVAESFPEAESNRYANISISYQRLGALVISAETPERTLLDPLKTEGPIQEADATKDTTKYIEALIVFDQGDDKFTKDEIKSIKEILQDESNQSSIPYTLMNKLINATTTKEGATQEEGETSKSALGNETLKKVIVATKAIYDNEKLFDEKGSYTLLKIDTSKLKDWDPKPPEGDISGDLQQMVAELTKSSGNKTTPSDASETHLSADQKCKYTLFNSIIKQSSKLDVGEKIQLRQKIAGLPKQEEPIIIFRGEPVTMTKTVKDFEEKVRSDPNITPDTATKMLTNLKEVVESKQLKDDDPEQGPDVKMTNKGPKR